MKKTLLSCFVGLSLSVQAFATSDYDFYNAITLCPVPNNPLENGLKVLNGNIFSAIKIKKDEMKNSVEINAEVWDSAQALNLSIIAPDVKVGSIFLKMYYETKHIMDKKLVCELIVNKI